MESVKDAEPLWGKVEINGNVITQGRMPWSEDYFQSLVTKSIQEAEVESIVVETMHSKSVIVNELLKVLS